ncbi:hypothetical protein Tco_0153242 [Tanacetum coccineum]
MDLHTHTTPKTSIPTIVFRVPAINATITKSLTLDRNKGLITFMDGVKEVTFKTLYRDSEMDELTSEGRDLLSSRVILSEDDYSRGCERASDLESRFYKDIDKLGPSYNA